MGQPVLNFFSVSSIKEVVAVCRWFKIGHAVSDRAVCDQDEYLIRLNVNVRSQSHNNLDITPSFLAPCLPMSSMLRDLGAILDDID
jgi:hypothetical protein